MAICSILQVLLFLDRFRRTSDVKFGGFWRWSVIISKIVDFDLAIIVQIKKTTLTDCIGVPKDKDKNGLRWHPSQGFRV